MFAHYEDIKRNAKSGNWDGLGVIGYSGAPAMSQFDRMHMTSC